MSLPVKILYIGSLERQSNSCKRFMTLKKMGYEVEGIDIDPYIFGTIWMRFHFHLYVGPGIIRLNNAVKEKVSSFNPDLIWVDNKPYLKKNTLQYIKKLIPQVKIVNVITDDPFGKYHYAWRFIYHTFKWYDVHFVQREINISELKKHGAKRVETCFRSFDPSFHIHMPNSDELLPYKTEVGFIGSYEVEREDYIAYLVENGISVSITGDGWPNGKHWSMLKKYYKGPSVYGDEYIKTINGMDIALHFLRKANRDQQDSRTFEIPACGTFMLAERSHLHSNFFEEGKEADFFTSKEELLDKVKFYVKDTAKRNSIAAAGFKRSFKSGYDHESRLKKVISQIYDEGQLINKRYNSIVVGIYYDPEFYPPTINAIVNLSETCDELVVITRNHAQLDYPYPGNVRMIKTGKFLSVIESEQQNLLSKIISFVKFSLTLFNSARNKNTELMVLYDSIPLFSYFTFRKLLHSQKKIWYHNHDIPATHPIRKFSVSWFAAKYEKKAMESIQYFSLPSLDRLQYYPEWEKKDSFFLLPNYPSLKLERGFRPDFDSSDEMRLIYQGTIGEGHGLEQIISFLNEKISGKSLRLTLKGAVRTEYKKYLSDLALQYDVTDKLEWVPLGPYCELHQLTSRSHIGIAIYLKSDKVRDTIGTASNKIYEYAASGLPVIVYDNAQFRKHLDRFSWVFFYDGTTESLKKCIADIWNDYENISSEAKNSFVRELNFEKYFGFASDDKG